MSAKTYLDDYETPEEKTEAIIQNLYFLIDFKGYKSIKDFEAACGIKKSYLPTCKHSKEIGLKHLMIYCNKLGTSIERLMSFNYENVAKQKEIEENEEEIKRLESELAKRRMKLKLDKQALNEAYRVANIKGGN